MKKALIVTAYSGFLPQFELGDVRILQEKGFEVHFVSNFHIPFYEYDPDIFEREHIICHQMDISKHPSDLGINIKAYKQLKALMQKENFDLVHVHNPVAGVLGRLAARHSHPIAEAPERVDNSRSKSHQHSHPIAKTPEPTPATENKMHQQSQPIAEAPEPMAVTENKMHQHSHPITENKMHQHSQTADAAGGRRSQRRKTNPFVIYTPHGLHFYKGAPLPNILIYRTVERFMAHYTDMIITINQEDFQSASKMRLRKGGSPERIYGVGVDEERFNEDRSQRDLLRRELGIPEEGFHILTAAELTGNKNQEVVIRAVAALNNPNIYYTLCGKGDDKEKLENLIRELHMENQIHIIGYRKDMNRILQSVDCFAFPSLREGLGLAAVEALMSGVPVIASDNRGSREYMKHMDNGIVCYRNQPEEYEAGIRQMYEDQELYQRMKQNARASVMQFSKTSHDGLMEKIYSKAVQRIAAKGMT